MKKRITMTKKDDLTIEQAFELFIRKATVRNLSPNTIRVYGYHFDSFCKYVSKDDLISTVSSDTIDGFILYLKENANVNDITINSYMRTIRSFLYYCMENGYIPQFKITMIKAEKKIKETYSELELEKLLKKPNLKKCGFTEYKTWVFENYLLGTGNRISSALNVRICDVDFDNEMILIRKSKNRKQQLIPLSHTLSEVLKEYLLIRNGNSEDFLFCNMYGEQGNRRTFQQEVQEYNLRRGVNKTSCHLFRHTFAKHWILAGGDIIRLQKVLGHYDLEMTKEYLQMFGQDLQQDFDSFNPLDKLRKTQIKAIHM